MKEIVDEIASSHPDILQTHGFYVDFEYKRMVFDAVVAFSKEHKLKFEAFEKDVKEAFPGYEIHVQMDIDVSD